MSPGHLPPFVAALRDPACYPHPVDRVEVIETHISWVLLAGEFAYKLKKPVDLGFADFSTLERRRHFCDEELRLNRRFAPGLYVAVVPVTGSARRPAMGGEGVALEYAVRMRRFPQSCLFDVMARRGELGTAHVDSLARRVAGLHQAAAVAAGDAAYGRPEEVLARALENIDALARGPVGDRTRDTLAALRRWTIDEHARLAPALGKRRDTGFVREGHGDLHLGNIVWIDGAPVPFDALEFSAALRWSDVMAEVAFVVMDLLAHGLPRLAWRFLDGYLEVTGDYDGVALLRFFVVYRALVRAKVAAIRASQDSGVAGGDPDLSVPVEVSRAWQPAIVAMHGLSGSGKSTVALQIVEVLGAVRVRSDVERKRLAARRGIGPDTLYSLAFTADVYARMEEIALALARAGWTAVVDAASLRGVERDRFAELARDLACPFRLVSCEAPETALRARIDARIRAGTDPSDATTAVLTQQLHWQEPLRPKERETALVAGPEDNGKAAEALRMALASARSETD